jgi:hypothetical protein
MGNDSAQIDAVSTAWRASAPSSASSNASARQRDAVLPRTGHSAEGYRQSERAGPQDGESLPECARVGGRSDPYAQAEEASGLCVSSPECKRRHMHTRNAQG